MTKLSYILRSYGSAANLSEVAQRLPALMIALWLGVISISMIPRLNIVEGGILFILFFISCLLIDSLLNPKRLKQPRVGSAVRIIGFRNYAALILLHLGLTVILAIHLSMILMKFQILFIIVIGLSLSIVNSRYISRMKSLSNMPNVTGVVSGVMLPMFGAFLIVGNEFDLFSLSIIIGIGFIYMGLEVFNQTRKDIEITATGEKQNSIEWEAINVASELGLPKSRIKELGLQLYNIHNESDFNQIPTNDRILFLPHCLRIADRCRATYDEEGLKCKHCSKECKINILTRAADDQGLRCFVVPGGAMVFNIAKKYNPQAVIAVACLNELREGASRTENEYKVPFQVIPLAKDGCVNTDVGVDEVLQIISTAGNRYSENN
jgi:hypothetical protein